MSERDVDVLPRNSLVERPDVVDGRRGGQLGLGVGDRRRGPARSGSAGHRPILAAVAVAPANSFGPPAHHRAVPLAQGLEQQDGGGHRHVERLGRPSISIAHPAGRTRVDIVGRRPWASLPDHERDRPGQVGVEVRRPAAMAAASSRRPGSPQRSTRSSSSTPSATGSRNDDAGRGAHRLRAQGSTEPGGEHQPQRPPRPRRPERWCRRCPDRPPGRARPPGASSRRAPRPARRSAVGAIVATAATGWGVTESSTSASTPVGDPRIGSPAVGRARRPRRRTRRRARCPAAIASATSVGPSITNRPVVVTRTAAPREAPQLLDLWVVGAERAQAAAAPLDRRVERRLDAARRTPRDRRRRGRPASCGRSRCRRPSARR